MAKSRYKLVDLGIVRDYEDTFDVGRKYMVTIPTVHNKLIGTLGILEDVYPGNPTFYVTPYQTNPFNTANGVRAWSSKIAALAWLEGIAEADEAWLRNAGQDLRA